MSAALGAGSPEGWLWAQMTAVADSRMASRKTSRGCASELVAVPEVISTHWMRRFLRFRQSTQNFSTSRPCINGRIKTAAIVASLINGSSRWGWVLTRWAISMTVMSWSAFTGPMPLSFLKSASFHVIRPAREPASDNRREARVSTSWPRVPLRSSMAKSSLSLSALGPIRLSRS